MKKILDLIYKLETKIQLNETVNLNVSNSTVGWQIEHSCKVILAIIEVLKNSNPDEYRRDLNLKRSVVLITKKIPRGVGKAPESVQPKGDSTKEILEDSIQSVYKKLNELEDISPKSFFKHPIFGNLNKKKTIRFLEIHTLHHYKIICDICKK